MDDSEVMTEEFYDHKKENVPYTFAIIKPETVCDLDRTNEIIDKIEEHGFGIKAMLQREPTKQEIQNLFYKHVKAEWYREAMIYMTCGDCLILLLTHETEDPIKKWKELIGPSDPEIAKKDAPESLRALYGIDRIKNEFHGSDDHISANRERDIFKFAIPQQIPKFEYDTQKIELDSLFKFLYPPNIEHPRINARLDVFALYGPIVNHHSVDKCFCKKCQKPAKEYLNQLKKHKYEEEYRSMGLEMPNEVMKSLNKTNIKSKKCSLVKIPPIRLLNETGVQAIWQNLCDKCQNHCSNFVHLPAGRNQQHLVTDLEIRELADQINFNDLLDLLTIEKGKAARLMITTINTSEPKDFQYDRELISHLLRDLETDYYNRYSFSDMQQVILEDRRIRMNAWLSQLIGKPVERFKNPKLIDPTVTRKQRQDVKNINFTILRTLPLTQTVKRSKISYTPLEFPRTIIDKKRLNKNEEKLQLQKMLHRYTTLLLGIENCNDRKFTQNVYLLRKYNQGRHGSWNNYCSLKGIQRGTYVKSKNKKSKNLRG